MGFALAQAAADAGATVELIAGPVNLSTPERVKRVDVISAQEMYEQSIKLAEGCDIFIACAAVADYRPEQYQEQKIKKEQKSETLQLTLVKNPDIVSAVTQLEPKPFVLGFAAESQNLEENAKNKLERKSLDMIAANNISNQDIGFNSEQNAVTLLFHSPQGIEEKTIEQTSKYQLATQLINHIVNSRATQTSEV
jgi:phosphopantothenoylcysteine decarboxylase/phosphopantothenate--cysteine ligase